MLSLERHEKPNQHNPTNGLYILSRLCSSQLHKLLIILESHRKFFCVTVHWAVQKTHEWHIPEMQSRAQDLTFCINPTCFWHTQCSCYTTMVSSIKTKSCKIWLNSRFNRDAEPTLEAYTILWGNETTKKKWFSVELDLVWGCSRIHSLKKWAKNSSKTFQNPVQNFSTRFSPHYVPEKKDNVIPVQISFMQITQDLLLRSGNERSFSCLRCKKLPCAAYCQQQNPYDSFLCPHKTHKWKQNFKMYR